MTRPPRPRDLGIAPGTLPPGPSNSVTDVPGVRVGHHTLDHHTRDHHDAKLPVRTGVTVVVPAPGSLFRDKPTAGLEVVNGFGKAAGLSQIAELGVLETPLALTNTLAVGAAYEGLVRHALDGHPEIGVSTGTVNPAVFECNDGWLNDIRGLHVRPDHVLEALRAASDGPVREGAVGAGTGMVAFGWKAGIGSSSRLVDAGDGTGFTLGALVLANFGLADDLTVLGNPVGRTLTPQRSPEQAEFARGAGSCVVLIATDAPADARQLRRIARRATVGLARTGGIVLATVGSSIGVALATGTSYLTILIPGEGFKQVYAEHGLEPKNLSRTLEDSGTVMVPLIPWSEAGMYMSTTLGVATLAYAPYAFLCYLGAVFAVLCGYTGIGIARSKQPTRGSGGPAEPARS